jgi:hypothetical protein
MRLEDVGFALVVSCAVAATLPMTIIAVALNSVVDL